MAIGFTSGSPYHHSYETEGNETILDTFHFTRHSFAGVQTNDGKADAFSKVKDGLDVDALQKKAIGWENVHGHVNGVWQKLDAAYNKLFVGDAWSGDDATKAAKTFRDTTDSASNLAEYSGNMHQGTSTIAKAAAEAKGQSSGGPSGLAQVANYETLGLTGFNGDGDKAEQAYFTLVGKIGDGRDQMPTQLEWQAKPSDGADGGPTPPISQQGGHQGPGGGGVSGVSAPRSATGVPQHTAVTTTGIKHPSTQPHVHHVHEHNTDTQDPVHTYQGPYDNGTDHGGTDGLANGTSGVGASGVGGAGLGHGGSGIGLDTGSSLAGVDGSGVGGGAGGGLGGGAGGGVGGGAGGGVGSGSGAGLGGGAGSGLGGASGAGLGAGGGSAGGGLGADGGSAGGGLAGGGLAGGGLAGGGPVGSGSGVAGAGGARAGANGRGGVGGQAPMRGGGGGGDESERERSTWLQEDDDVWGESDAPPSVIS